MTPERIKELRALCVAATPGPWMDCGGMISGEVAVCAMLQYQPEANARELADAALIAAARTALPEALAEIERLQEYLLGKETALARNQTEEIKRLRALVPAWRPIETAPKDGTPIVALTRDGLAVVIARHLIDDDTSAWCTAHDDAIPSSWHDGICWGVNADGKESDPPVVWTPLPNPPEEKK